MPIRVSSKYVTSSDSSNITGTYDWCKVDDFTGTIVLGSQYDIRDSETILSIGAIYRTFWDKAYEEICFIKNDNRPYYNEIVKMIMDNKSSLMFFDGTELCKQIEQDYIKIRNDEEWKKNVHT